MSRNVNELRVDMQSGTEAIDDRLQESSDEYSVASERLEASRAPSVVLQRALGRVADQMVRPLSNNGNINGPGITAFNSAR